MSVLAPLYLLGLAAISLPLIFHLIRRTPRGEMPFSSLMFLQPFPPRLTKRSRLENLLLLLLRGLAIGLLALAFARPFFRQAALISTDDVGQQRVAVLVDTSASMRRGDLWQQAIAALDRKLAQFRPQDRIAVFAFDETLRPVASHQDLANIDLGRRQQMGAQLMRHIEPGWAGTHLGRALLDALASLEEMQDAEGDDATRRVVVISDLQSGSRLDLLGEHDWPQDARLELAPLATKDPTNAGLELLGQRAASQTVEQARDQRLRIRVRNAADSSVESFRLLWQSSTGEELGNAIDVHVPVGESRVARVSLPAATGSRLQLVLEGDAFDFDNTIYFLPQTPDTVHILYLGSDDPRDAAGMAYYVERAVESDHSHTVEISHMKPGAQAIADGQPPQLVVVTDTPSPTQSTALRQYLERGGVVLYVVTGKDDAEPLASLLGVSELVIADAAPDDYAMLSEIEFNHPLFSAMSGPQFNNFTQIRFWKYRRWDESSLENVKILARFDSGDAAILQKPYGAGELLVMNAGWHPDDSQLARSWKFLLMIASMMDAHRQETAFAPSYRVNQRVPLPRGIELATNPTLAAPDGDELVLANDATFIDGVDQPGVYRLATTKGPVEFAVHVDPAESDTEPLPQEAFEQLGALTTTAFDVAVEQATMQQMRDAEVESGQKVWKWLVALALIVLIAETLLAGRLSRPAEPAVTTAPSHSVVS